MGGLFEKPVVRLVGEAGLLFEYGDAIAPEINRKVRAIAAALAQESPPGVIEVIPTYRSLLLLYDPLVTDPDGLEKALLALEERLEAIEIPPPARVEIPVCYGHDFGPDIEFVAQNAGRSVDEVIRLHSQPEYQIYMIGFTPGFPFLGGLPKVLTTPRLKTPRTLVPAGSVGIADKQTGMYPIASPGGWRIIGRTPLRLFDPTKSQPFLYQAGDLLRYKPISAEEFRRVADGAV
ncbi:MAG: 5-oxoprolinase subunit PxpB [Deltaproteobacteria bacterium]|nr:5-oxoprolinase subunit PxpB [Deltaproteobacteria bacterium]